jgi:hypothetical protein
MSMSDATGLDVFSSDGLYFEVSNMKKMPGVKAKLEISRPDSHQAY